MQELLCCPGLFVHCSATISPMRSSEDIQPEFARYETPAATHRALGLCCTGSGFAMRKRYVCGPRTLGCYGAVFVGKGSGWIETAATFGRLPIDGGALFWLFPTIAHTYAPDPSGWVERWVLFEGPLADTFEQLGFISPARPRRSRPCSRKRTPILHWGARSAWFSAPPSCIGSSPWRTNSTTRRGTRMMR